MNTVNAKTKSIITTCILFFGILLVWIYKIPFLSIPFFTDEAWSYAPAVWAMYQNHPCLMPGCIPVDLYRGHPLLFYFITASVAKIFGFSPFVLHLFALTVASTFLFIFFFILRRYTNPAFALFGSLLLLSQEVFIVQSSYMLPEIFISMLTMVLVFSLLTGRNFLYFISATLLVITKESGLVIIAAVCIAAFTMFIKKEQHVRTKTFSSLVSYFFLITSPLLIGMVFYISQKMICGWYFYPLHIELMSFSLNSVLQHWTLIREFVFTGYGRKNLLVLSGLIIVLLFIYRRRLKTLLLAGTLKITWILLTVFAFYLFFSLINFIALRYLILLIVIFIFLLTTWSYQLHQSGFKLFPYVFCVVTGFSLYHDFTSNPSWIDDVSMNYKDEVVVHQQAAGFMEDTHDYSKKIFTFFMMQHNLTRPELFYIHGPSFTNVTSDTLAKDADYYIFSNLMLVDTYYDFAKSNHSLQLLKRFEKGKAWCEIYGRN